MNPVNWFEIATKDLARAKGFYEHVLGYSLTSMEMGPAKMELFPGNQAQPGSAGALIHTEGHTPSHEGTCIYFSVEDIPGTLARVNARGGKTLQEKMGIGDYGFIGLFEDSEGNRIGLHSQS